MSLLYWRFSIILPVIRTAALVTMTLAPCSAVEPQKPSVTAMIVLLFRAMGATNPDVSLRNPDYLALKFLGSRERETLLDARVRTSGTAKTEPLPIDLGRAYRQDRPANSRFFEVAFPATQEYKKQRVREIFGSLPKDIVYVAIDFQKGDLAAALRNAGWRRNRKTFFIWEGVTFYLPEAAVDATLRFVAAESAPGSLIVFDYAADRLIRGEHDDERMKRSLGLAKFIGEPWQFGFPMNGASEWIMQRYLKVVSDLGPKDVTRKYLTSANGISIGEAPWRLGICLGEVATEFGEDVQKQATISNRHRILIAWQTRARFREHN